MRCFVCGEHLSGCFVVRELPAVVLTLTSSLRRMGQGPGRCVAFHMRCEAEFGAFVDGFLAFRAESPSAYASLARLARKRL